MSMVDASLLSEMMTPKTPWRGKLSLKTLYRGRCGRVNKKRNFLTHLELKTSKSSKNTLKRKWRRS